MSLLSRIFKNPGPAAQSADVPRAVEPAQPAVARPDKGAVARSEESALAEALASGDAAAVARWVVEGSTTHVRQQAARAIQDPQQLLELIPAARGHDKHVYRILTGKRDELLARERAARELDAELAAAAAAVEKHAGRAWDRSYAETLARLQARWDAIAANAPASQRQAVEAHLHQAREVLVRREQELVAEAERQRQAAQAADEARRARELEASAAEARAAEQSQRLEAERNAERERVRALHATEDAAAGELIALLRQAQAALGHGGTARAARLRDTLKEKLAAAPAHALPPWFARKVQELDAQIDELKDWKTFTVVPKRAELLRRMQSLIGAEMSPEELARQVRRLREEWRTLHRGAADEPGPEREQFEQLAERAYEPCREHFGRQAEVRAANRAQREALLERLRAFIARQQADDPPDWRLIQQVLTEARREWREHAPVDQDAVRPLQEQLAALLDPLQARLDAEYAANAAAKRDLIARAAALAGSADIRAAIAEAKDLQRSWKAVGPVRRKEADALWEEFRRHCDAVFQRSAQEAAAHGASLETHRSRAAVLCEEVERICALREEALLDATRGLAGLREEFDGLELPRAGARELRQRFQRALEECETALRRDRAANQRRGWTDALQADARLRTYALAAVRNAPADEIEARRADARAALDALERAPKAARAALERQFARVADGGVGMDLAASALRLRMLCLRAELSRGVESPAEDTELRREHQMQRLVGAMTEGRRAQSESPEDLILEWLGADPADAPVQDALSARFERCLGLAAGA